MRAGVVCGALEREARNSVSATEDPVPWGDCGIAALVRESAGSFVIKL